MSSHTGRKGTSQKVRYALWGERHGRLQRILLGLLYLTSLSLLVLWEYRDRLESLSSECELRDQVKSTLYTRSYEKLLDWAASDAVGHVVTLAIPSDLEEVQKNLCLGRAYLADVLRTLASQTPAVVVIDKFYSAGTCASAPASTQKLIDAARNLKVPVVIGEATDGLEYQVGSSCLVRKPQLQFDVPNVRHGVTRVNSEPERLPLRWLVLSAPPNGGRQGEAHAGHGAERGNPEAEFADSLSFAAAKAYDPALAGQRKIRRLIAQDDHAYANLAIEIPKITTTQLLCSAGDESLRKRWSVSCVGQAPLPNLLGKVIVIGAESLTDEKIVLQRRIWGFELQARYIETLLSGDYLGYLPIWWGLVLFGLFVFLIEGVPTILHARRPGWKRVVLLRHAYPHRRYVWVVSWAILVIGASAVVSLALRFLPPLLVYGDILFVAVTRLLFFFAQSAEDPFLHAHSHRKVHAMTTPQPEAPKPNASALTGTVAGSTHKALPKKPFTPSGPIEPAPVPTTTNNPGTEGGTEG